MAPSPAGPTGWFPSVGRTRPEGGCPQGGGLPAGWGGTACPRDPSCAVLCAQLCQAAPSLSRESWAAPGVSLRRGLWCSQREARRSGHCAEGRGTRVPAPGPTWLAEKQPRGGRVQSSPCPRDSGAPGSPPLWCWGPHAGRSLPQAPSARGTRGCTAPASRRASCVERDCGVFCGDAGAALPRTTFPGPLPPRGLGRARPRRCRPVGPVKAWLPSALLRVCSSPLPSAGRAGGQGSGDRPRACGVGETRYQGLPTAGTPGMAWYSMAWHGMARHGMAWHGMAQHGMARLGLELGLVPTPGLPRSLLRGGNAAVIAAAAPAPRRRGLEIGQQTQHGAGGTPLPALLSSAAPSAGTGRPWRRPRC